LDFFIFAVFSTLTRPGLPGVKSPPPPGVDVTQQPRPAGEAGRIAQGSARRKIFLKNFNL